MSPSNTDWVTAYPYRGERREFVSPNVGLMHSFAYWKRFGIIKHFDYPWRIVDVGACVGGFVVPFLENLPNATADLFEVAEAMLELL